MRPSPLRGRNFRGQVHHFKTSMAKAAKSWRSLDLPHGERQAAGMTARYERALDELEWVLEQERTGALATTAPRQVVESALNQRPGVAAADEVAAVAEEAEEKAAEANSEDAEGATAAIAAAAHEAPVAKSEGKRKRTADGAEGAEAEGAARARRTSAEDPQRDWERVMLAQLQERVAEARRRAKINVDAGVLV